MARRFGDSYDGLSGFYTGWRFGSRYGRRLRLINAEGLVWDFVLGICTFGELYSNDRRTLDPQWSSWDQTNHGLPGTEWNNGVFSISGTIGVIGIWVLRRTSQGKVGAKEGTTLVLFFFCPLPFFCFFEWLNGFCCLDIL